MNLKNQPSTALAKVLSRLKPTELELLMSTLNIDGCSPQSSETILNRLNITRPKALKMNEKTFKKLKKAKVMDDLMNWMLGKITN